VRFHTIAPHEIGPVEVEAWEALRAADRDLGSPYFSPHWTKLVARHRKDIKVAVITDDAGKFIGFFPVQRPSSWSAMPVGAPLCDYQGLIGAADFEFKPRDLAKALGVGRIDFTHLLAKQTAFTRSIREHDGSWVVDVDGNDDTYVRTKKDSGSSSLKKIEQKRRKWERESNLPLTFQCFEPSKEGFLEMLAWKEDQYQRTGQINPLAHDWARRVVEETFDIAEPGFQGALFTLRLGERIVAYNYCLMGNNVLHDWFIAHDRSYDEYSPGLLLSRDLIRCAAARGLREIDFGPGDYQYKRTLATRQRVITNGFVSRPGPSSLLRGLFYDVRTLAAGAPLGNHATLPARAMRRMDVWRGLSSAQT
jgi:CelD/BcsL family acetyltransferase involved in cellulose biosynthesis